MVKFMNNMHHAIFYAYLNVEGQGEHGLVKVGVGSPGSLD